MVSVDKDGTVLRLKDMNRIELGALSYDYLATVNGAPGVMCMISQTSGSNANEIITDIDKLVEEISEDLLAGLEIADLMSTKDFLDAHGYKSLAVFPKRLFHLRRLRQPFGVFYYLCILKI